MLDVTYQLDKIKTNLNDEYYLNFVNDAEFIDDTLRILNSNNLISKKTHFIDYQDRIAEVLNNLHNLLEVLENYAPGISEDDGDLISLYKLVGIVIKRLEFGIKKFNEDLQANKDTVKEEIIVNEETIKEAVNNNETTKQIVEGIDTSNNRLTDVRNDISKDFFKNKKKQKNTVEGYLIASQDLSDHYIVNKTNLSKDDLNIILMNCNIDNARVFQLKEIPTVQKTIKKTISIIQ